MEPIMEFVEVLHTRPDHAYDWIANEYYRLSKGELVSITKELLYAIHTNADLALHDKILADAGDELEDGF